MAFDPLTSLFNLGESLIQKLLPDPTAKAAAIQKLAELQMNGDLAVMAAQANINMTEAQSKNVFVAGWRPAVGWVCAAAFAIQFVVGPLLLWGASMVGHPFPVPEMNMTALMPILIGMLGLGGMRTVEKLAGAQNDNGSSPGPVKK